MSRILLPEGFSFPKDCWVAVSGGLDSMALLSFLLNGRKLVKVCHFDHQTQMAYRYKDFVEKFCFNKNIPFKLGTLREPIPPGESKEAWWASKRHQFFSSLDGPVLLAHHLDDALETWFMSSAMGRPHLTNWTTNEGKCIRPLLLNRKSTLQTWCLSKGIPWIEDYTNNDVSIPRNRIRHNVIPEMELAYPGLATTIRNKLKESNPYT